MKLQQACPCTAWVTSCQAKVALEAREKPFAADVETHYEAVKAYQMTGIQ